MSSIDIEATLVELQKRDIVRRIWHRDYTIWKPEPKEITNRLGWLNITDQMNKELFALTAFADGIHQAGFQNVVLLGMGGASLGAEVLRQVFGSIAGYPELIVLDSTVPAWVLAVSEAINPARTLFLVSSKSGGTIETLSLYKYFRSKVEQVVGKKHAGQNFVTITDPGTSLVELAKEADFRHTFLNPPDIGGRYSVLSYFGLVPAALIGVNIAKLLERADNMRKACILNTLQNPGALLGAIMGNSALRGQDRLTLITSPSIGSFGLWLEQLIAESTGKDNKGIIPIVGEPIMDPAYYGNNRLFVYLRLEDDDNVTTDATIKNLKASGQPIVKLDLDDRYGLGAEFFRWEFATAVAGAILGIHPFDQPDVQATKDATGRLLIEFRVSGRLPKILAPRSLEYLLNNAKPDKYLSIMTYLHQTPEVDEALIELRGKLLAKYQVATTSSYGPRLLHSTGQLHKGGPNTGLFLQITAEHRQDLPIPDEPFTFSVLADAQALGDFEALQSVGRNIARIHLWTDEGKAIKSLSELI